MSHESAHDLLATLAHFHAELRAADGEARRAAIHVAAIRRAIEGLERLLELERGAS